MTGPWPTVGDRWRDDQYPLLVIAAGASLRYAVTATVAGIDLQTVGSILLVVGVVGLPIGLWLGISGRERERVRQA